MSKSPREIDALLAEHVMGWGKFNGQECVGVGAGGFNKFRRLLPFSTDPAASKQLRNRMKELGWWCQMRNEWGPEYPGCWAGFTPNGATGWNGRPDNWTKADNEEMAVAMAALAALGVQL